METKLYNAYARFENGLLEVSTGKISRKWKWLNSGFTTLEISGDIPETVYKNTSIIPDFDVFGVSKNANAELRSVNAYIANTNLTSVHIEIETVITYSDFMINAKYVIWVYPGAFGLRTQLYLKANGNYKPDSSFGSAVIGESTAETITFIPERIKAMGYYNDTQHRNKAETEIIREENYSPVSNLEIDWASLIALFDKNGNGICVVKESNKCVNQASYDTGGFVFQNNNLRVTGIGIKPDDLREDRYLFAWANWTILFKNGDEGLETAVKEFDRLRFPIISNRDIYIMSNTWGNTGDDDAPGTDSAAGNTALENLKVSAEIGVDVFQIDSGWHSPMGTKSWATEMPWYTHVSKYPTGWDMVKKPADELGVDLGVWFAWTASADEMIDNMRQANFKYFKIDFAHLDTRERLDSMIDKAEKLYIAGEGDVRINWDVTENPARMGYYFAREFGNIYLENRKPKTPVNVIYTPYLVLRDAWQLAKYTNINKFQITLQNIDLIDRTASDAYKHNFPYCAMIAFTGSPILFQQVRFLTPEARRQLKEIISVYKKYRDDMYKCFVYPIGNKPDNRSWTGFQFVNGDHGFIILFRELNNMSKTEKIQLKFIKNRNISATDIMTSREQILPVNENGCISFIIEKPCDFVWYKY